MDKRHFNVVAFSDPHVGRTWSAHCTPATRDALRGRYLDPIKEVLKRFDPTTRVICGGDWFDRSHNSEALIAESLELMAGVHVLIAGNHDHSGRASAVTSLGLIDELGMVEGLIYNREHLNELNYSMDGSSGILVFTVPHHGTQELFERACMEAADHAKHLGKPAILILHANVGAIGGGKPDSSLYLTPQLQAAIEEPFQYILCGHEHLPRRQGKLIVMGSTQPCTFGELGPRFFWGFTLLEDGKIEVEQIPIESALSHAVVDITGGVPEAPEAELLLIKGRAPLSAAREVQQLVRQAYAGGALAVKVDVEFIKGDTAAGEKVASSLNNLVNVIEQELSGNQEWLDLFHEALDETKNPKGKV